MSKEVKCKEKIKVSLRRLFAIISSNGKSNYLGFLTIMEMII